MYSHFRSTERHLKLLSVPFGLKSKAAGKRNITPNGFSNSSSFKDTTRKSGLFSNQRTILKPSIRTIKVKSATTRSLTTASETTISTSIKSFLNPSKPSPENLKDVIIEPITPRTLPRFNRNIAAVPSVTKVLQETMPAASKFLLDRWKEMMIKKLGAAGFNKYQQETFERGKLLHALVANYLLGSGGPKEISMEVVANLWNSIQNVVKDSITNVRLVEHVVTHPDMKYRGIVDCVACYKDELVVIDFKTAEKPKKSIDSLYDNPIQVTAYCAAINNDQNIPLSVIDRNICSGLVVVAYVDGSEASVYYLGRDKVNEYWKQWTIRLEQYTQMVAMKVERNDAL